MLNIFTKKLQNKLISGPDRTVTAQSTDITFTIILYILIWGLKAAHIIWQSIVGLWTSLYSCNCMAITSPNELLSLETIHCHICYSGSVMWAFMYGNIQLFIVKSQWRRSSGKLQDIYNVILTEFNRRCLFTIIYFAIPQRQCYGH